MFNLHRHRGFFAAIVAFLLALSSSGFTAVLHSCLMAQEKSCCDVSLMREMASDEGVIPGTPVLKNNMSCCTITVAGGLNTNPIVIGDQAAPLQHLEVLALIPPVEFSGAQHILTHSTLVSASVAASPPSVEKYVLNSTFLI
jgi:hypothetical protein